MYKVFLNDKVIILTPHHDLELMEDGFLFFQYDDFEELNFVVSLLETNDALRGSVIQYSLLDELWADFRAHFREIDAAGGLVRNDSGEVLFIHRLGKWDLPKGKREMEEEIADCALREVREECGLEDLTLVKPLSDTYHAYHMNGIRFLKRTYWFEMRSNQQHFVPQAEEGITDVLWVHPSAINWDKMPTYRNIKSLIDREVGPY